MKKKIGIDLGTTNSLPSVFDELSGRAEVLVSRNGSRMTPSAVNIDDEGRYVIGNIARQNALLYPDQTIENFKRLMGKTKSAFTVGGRTYSPQFLSALVLMSMKKDIEAYLNKEDFDVVITVPAYFDSDACQATKEAGVMAGLSVLDIIHEPVAAVYHYASDTDLENQIILVVDLGGGTLDVAVVRITKDEIVELVIDGCAQLGGIDFDEALCNYIRETYLQGKTMEPDDEQEFLVSVEKAKRILSEKSETRFVVRTCQGREMIRITREEFEACTRHLMGKIEEVLKRVRKEMQGKESIDRIFLVGGATRMPQIEKLLKQQDLFPKAELSARDQDEAVARGAAVYAQNFETDQKMFRPKKLKRISPYSYGIKALVNVEKKIVKISNMISKNAELPVKVSRKFQTAEDGQKQVNISVYESVKDGAYLELSDGALLGSRTLEIQGELPAQSELLVSFTLNEDGTLVAVGEEPKGKTKVDVVIEPKALHGAEELMKQKKRLEEMKSQ